MERSDYEALRAKWLKALLPLVVRSEWGAAHPREVPGEGDIDLVYWADFFKPPRLVETIRPSKGLGVETARQAGHAVMRQGLRTVDALAVHSNTGRPADAVSAWVDRLVQQTALYMNNGPVYRANPEHGDGAYFQVQARFAAKLSSRTSLVIGHSLGSVIAYEALCRLPHQVHTFITVGSPIATPKLILEPLRRRMSQLRGHPVERKLPWPGVRKWTNVFAKADVWCVPVPRFNRFFEGTITDVEVDHGTVARPSRTHALPAYLKHREVGHIIGEALRAIAVETAAPAVA
jgi:hypothetical protein